MSARINTFFFTYAYIIEYGISLDRFNDEVEDELRSVFVSRKNDNDEYDDDNNNNNGVHRNFQTCIIID